MVRAAPGILARIVARKREELARDAARLPELILRAHLREDFRDFKRALTSNPPAIIAEIKKASPSKGVFTEDFDAARIARVYAQSGAAALSVLTDQDFFSGSLADLESARQATNVPVLRKDFTLTDFHVYESAAHGADAILLIAAILDTAELRKLRELASQLHLASIIEVHDSEELQSAVESGAEIIGVNNRDLNTFDVRIANSRLLAPKVPANTLKIAESGIHSGDDVRLLRQSGYDAFLVGERLMKSPDPSAALKELRR
jgi:indole-3-glycerol phosphate synthase